MLRKIYCEGDNPQNTGYKKVCKNNLAAVVGLWLVAKDTSMTPTEALTESTWHELRKNPKATRGYPFPLCDAVALIPKEAVYRDTPFEGSKKTADGLYGFEFSIDKHYSVIQRLRSHQGGQYEVVLIMQNGIIVMTSDDDTNLRGLTIQSLTIPQDMFSDGATGHLAKVRLVLADATEWDERGWAAKPDDFNIKTIEGLYPVVHTITNVTGTGFDFDVITAGASADDPNAQWPGLVVADFVLTTAAGAPVTITGITDNDDGSYHAAATLANGNYLFSLDVPANISVAEYGIETLTVAAFTKA